MDASRIALREYRQRQRLSREELAERFGVATITMARWLSPRGLAMNRQGQALLAVLLATEDVGSPASPPRAGGTEYAPCEVWYG